MDNKSRIEVAQWILERNLVWIAAADIKVGVIVGINTAMGGGLAAAYNDASHKTLIVISLSVLASILGALSVLYAAMAVLPHVNGPKKSLMFFGCISAVDREEYLISLKSASEEDFLNDLSRQIHRNAEIARDKYICLGKSMRLALLFAAAWASSLFLLVRF